MRLSRYRGRRADFSHRLWEIQGQLLYKSRRLVTRMFSEECSTSMSSLIKRWKSQTCIQIEWRLRSTRALHSCPRTCSCSSLRWLTPISSWWSSSNWFRHSRPSSKQWQHSLLWPSSSPFRWLKTGMRIASGPSKMRRRIILSARRLPAVQLNCKLLRARTCRSAALSKWAITATSQPTWSSWRARCPKASAMSKRNHSMARPISNRSKLSRIYSRGCRKTRNKMGASKILWTGSWAPKLNVSFQTSICISSMETSSSRTIQSCLSILIRCYSKVVVCATQSGFSVSASSPGTTQKLWRIVQQLQIKCRRMPRWSIHLWSSKCASSSASVSSAQSS